MKPRYATGFALLLGLACAKGAGSGEESSDDDGTGSGGGGLSGIGDCPEGSEEVGGDCVDIDECALGTDDCDPVVTCVNDDPGFHCEPCPSGTNDVNGDGTECEDIDECAEQADNCDPLVECVNDVPGFHCGPCPNGTTDENGDGTLCTSSNVVGLDDRHGFDATLFLGTGTYQSDFRAAITTAGKSIVTLNALETANLAGLGALFVQLPYDMNNAPLTASEIAAIVAFVGGGGGLVVIGDGGNGGNQTNLNLLAQNWGVTFSTNPLWPSGLVVSALVAHPVTTGVTSFGLDYGVPMTVTTPAVALNTGGEVALAAVTGSAGSGNVVFISDGCFNNSAGSDYNIFSLSNALLLANIVEFVTP
jgi:hypothetical protein